MRGLCVYPSEIKTRRRLPLATGTWEKPPIFYPPCFLERIVLSRINAQAGKPFREDRQKQNTRQERTCRVEKEDEFLRT
ncbi:hypothetical protein CXU17_06110 [Akkermansia muciniphila]|nr:hypothetical protein CXU17_06110 [Akkermansia muciniphila]